MNETQKQITLKIWMLNTWFSPVKSCNEYTVYEVFSDAVTANLTIGEIDLKTCRPTKQFYDFFEELETIKNEL
tara:strand:- start:989 stop:1207 length:219 start_codon:yes stop_codon:yes gene_type:complete